MYQGRSHTLRPAIDDVWLKPSDKKAGITLGPAERGISVLSGGLFLFLGLRRRSVPLLLGGGALIYRGAAGKCPVYRAVEQVTGAVSHGDLELEESITVNRPAVQVYDLWRRLENLPRFMSHLESVKVDNATRSHWVARLPAPLCPEWDAEIVDDQPGKSLSWRSLPGASIQHTGSVLFHSVPSRQSTEVKIILDYRPPVGRAGAAVAKLLNLVTTNQIRSDLRAFKAVAETGERPTNTDQPSGRSAHRGKANRREA